MSRVGVHCMLVLLAWASGRARNRHGQTRWPARAWIEREPENGEIISDKGGLNSKSLPGSARSLGTVLALMLQEGEPAMLAEQQLALPLGELPACQPHCSLCTCSGAARG